MKVEGWYRHVDEVDQRTSEEVVVEVEYLEGRREEHGHVVEVARESVVRHVEDLKKGELGQVRHFAAQVVLRKVEVDQRREGAAQLG